MTIRVDWPDTSFSFFEGHNYSHVVVGLAGASLAQVFHKPAGQAWRLTMLKTGICILEVVSAMAHLLFVKDTMESLTSTN